MKFNEILAALRRREFKPVYWLQGEETYFIDAITDYIEKHALEDHEKDFNQSVLYAQDLEPTDLVSVVKRFPMMAPYQVVIVKEAQQWNKKLDALTPIIEQPIPTTILVINYRNAKVDGRSAIAKMLSKNAVYFTSEKLKDYQINDWVSNHATQLGFNLESRAATLLSENIGTDISKLVNAIEKLSVLAAETKMITADMVHRNIGIDKDFNIFELNNALGKRDARKAMLIANYFARNQKEHHIIPTVSMVAGHYARLIKYQYNAGKKSDADLAKMLGINPYFLKEFKVSNSKHSAESLMNAMEVLSEIDLKSKGVGSTDNDSGELMREMVARLLRV